MLPFHMLDYWEQKSVLNQELNPDELSEIRSSIIGDGFDLTALPFLGEFLGSDQSGSNKEKINLWLDNAPDISEDRIDQLLKAILDEEYRYVNAVCSLRIFSKDVMDHPFYLNLLRYGLSREYIEVSDIEDRKFNCDMFYGNLDISDLIESFDKTMPLGTIIQFFEEVSRKLRLAESSILYVGEFDPKKIHPPKELGLLDRNRLNFNRDLRTVKAKLKEGNYQYNLEDIVARLYKLVPHDRESGYDNIRFWNLLGGLKSRFVTDEYLIKAANNPCWEPHFHYSTFENFIPQVDPNQYFERFKSEFKPKDYGLSLNMEKYLNN